MDLARILRSAPAEVDTMDYRDSILLLEADYEAHGRERKWQAAIAGVKLK